MVVKSRLDLVGQDGFVQTIEARFMRVDCGQEEEEESKGGN